MAPVLFLFIIMGFAETLEKEWVRNDLTPLQFRRHDNSPLSNGCITSHKRNTFSEGTLFDIFCMLYVDDGAFAFPSRKELEIGSAVVRRQFTKFGLQMHVGSAIKASKTEAVFFPNPGFFKLPTLPPSEASSSSLPLVTKPKQENDATKRAREDKSYDTLSETQPITLPDGGIITFCKHFKYLGNYISYSLRDDYDIDHRLAQASSAMGSLQHFWTDDAVDVHSKYLIFCAIPLNLALWGCESWALRETMVRKLETFFHRSIRRILGITWTQVIDEHITNDSVRMRFCHIPSLWNQIAKWQLTFIGKVVRNSDSQIPTRLLTAWCDHPADMVRRCRVTRKIW